MSNAKHTQGPWTRGGSEVTLASWVKGPDGKRICTMRVSEQDWSNAALIAAAPETAAERDRLKAVNAELLAALEGLVAEFDRYAKETAGVARSRNAYAETARAALLKAREA